MNALYTVYKVIYYDYAWRFKIVDLYELIGTYTLNVTGFGFWWTPNAHDLFSPSDQSSSPFEALTDPNESVASSLHRVFPGWQSHQHREALRG